MSKRHTITGGSQPIPPIPSSVLFRENLVFYAPLNKGELFDYISGEVGATSQYAWATWDDNEQMYQLGFNYPTGTGHDCTALRFTSSAFLQNVARCFDNNACTIVMRYRDVSFTGNRWGTSRVFSMDAMVDVWPRNGVVPISNVIIDGYRQFTSNNIVSQAYLYRTVVVTCNQNRNNFKTYVNGTLKSTTDFFMGAYPISLGICDKNGHATQTSSPYNDREHIIYAKDIRIYDKLCTASEVQQLTNNVI